MKQYLAKVKTMRAFVEARRYLNATEAKRFLADPEILAMAQRGDAKGIAQYLHDRSGMTLSVGMVIGIFLVFIVGAAVLPTAFSQWFNASTTGWPTATQTLWPLVPLLGIVVIIAILAYKVSESHGKV